MDLRSEERREQERRAHGEPLFNDLWRTVPQGKAQEGRRRRRRGGTPPRLLGLPEENLLYFLEKTAPRLQGWQREILRIVRLIAQYFYPQRQTKMMNEGCATFTHHRIMTRLHEKGQIDDGAVPGIPALAHQRGDAAGLRRSPLSPASIPTRSASP